MRNMKKTVARIYDCTPRSSCWHELVLLLSCSSLGKWTVCGKKWKQRLIKWYCLTYFIYFTVNIPLWHNSVPFVRNFVFVSVSVILKWTVEFFFTDISSLEICLLVSLYLLQWSWYLVRLIVNLSDL